MRCMGVREYAGAMAATGMPYGATKLPVIREAYRKPSAKVYWRALVVRALTVAEIGLHLAGLRAPRMRESLNKIAAASRRRNRR